MPLTLYKQVKSPPQLLSTRKITIPTSIPRSTISGETGKVWICEDDVGSYVNEPRRMWSVEGAMDALYGSQQAVVR